jgi:DNA-directed RNA polymerase specialized sigma24 family protein
LREIAAFFEENYEKAIAYARGKGLDRASAQDVVALAFFVVLIRYDPARASLPAFFWAVLSRLVANEWRRRYRHPSVSADDSAVPELPDETDASEDIRLRRLCALLELLPAEWTGPLLADCGADVLLPESSQQRAKKTRAVIAWHYRLRQRLRALLHALGCYSLRDAVDLGEEILAGRVPVLPPSPPARRPPRPSCRPPTEK